MRIDRLDRRGPRDGDQATKRRWRGGRRAGAGRPPGAKNKRTLMLIAQVKKNGHELPLPRLLRRMNDKKLPEEYRDSLAAQAHPIVTPG